MSETQVNGDLYYKLTIVSIHRDTDRVTIWILGTWCYEPQEMVNVGLQGR